jgi:hypothetical protein
MLKRDVTRNDGYQLQRWGATKRSNGQALLVVYSVQLLFLSDVQLTSRTRDACKHWDMRSAPLSYGGSVN